MENMNTLVLAALALLTPHAALAQKPPATQEPPAAAPAPGPIERAAERYGAEAWKAGALRRGIPLGELELPNLVGDALECDGGALTRTFRSVGATSPAVVIRARVLEAPEDAQRVLLGWLGGISARALARPAVGLGDVGYMEPSRDAKAQAHRLVYFVRGNVAVAMWTYDPRETTGLDLLPFAKSIDAAVRATVRAEEQPLERLPRPEVDPLLVPERTVGPTPVPLAPGVRGPDGLECTLRWRVSGAGQGYVERDRAGAWAFHPTGPGEVTLTLEATSRLGVCTERSVTLQVEARGDRRR